jgi:hypothetical protein
MIDIILDSNCFAEFLAQYFNAGIANRGMGHFQSSAIFSTTLARRLNQIMLAASDGISNLIIASTFSLIEIARKWDQIVQGRFTTQQLHVFTYQYPEWFSLAPVDEDLIPFFAEVPSTVFLNSKSTTIEWTDAIHLATVISRGTNATLATTDSKAKKVLEIQGRPIL